MTKIQRELNSTRCFSIPRCVRPIQGARALHEHAVTMGNKRRMQMHPPPFWPSQQLSDWLECYVDAQCKPCNRRVAIFPMKLLISKYGNMQFSALLKKLRCQTCGQRPAPVYLCASPHRSGGHGGPEPDWAIEIIPTS